MKIGIIGSGNVGGALGQRWAAAGHDIKFGVRDAAKPELVALLKKIGARASAGAVAEAAAFGEILVLTTPWNGTQARREVRHRRRLPAVRRARREPHHRPATAFGARSGEAGFGILELASVKGHNLERL